MGPEAQTAETRQALEIGCSQRTSLLNKRELQDCHKHLLMASLKTA